MTNYKTEQEKQDKEFGEKFLVELKNNSGWKLPRIALYWEESGSNGYEWEDMEKDLKSYLLARDTALLEASKKDVGMMMNGLNITWRDRTDGRDDSYDDAFYDGTEVTTSRFLSLLKDYNLNK